MQRDLVDRCKTMSAPFTAEHMANPAHRLNIQHTFSECAAEIERLRKLTEWQPIDTAPKDGTEILGCWHSTHFGWQHATVFYDGAGFRDQVHWPVTHWTPLPQPPQGGE